MDTSTKKTFLLIQEGGSSTELYLHSWGTREEADADRVNCARDGSYRTSGIIEAPATLTEHPEFYDIVDQILSAVMNLELVAVPPTDDGDGETP